MMYHLYIYRLSLFYLQSTPPPPKNSSNHPNPHPIHQVTGAQGKLSKVLATAPRLFLFSALQLLLHLAFLVGVGRGVFRLPLKVGV